MQREQSIADWRHARELHGRLGRRPAATLEILLCAAALALLTGLAATRAVAQDSGGEVKAASATEETGQPAAPAGATESPSGPDTIRMRVEVVNVPVTVLDKRGLPVIDLTQADFEIYEDGVQQTIKYFSRELRPPLRIGLILDTSNSARPAMDFEKDAASEFVFSMLRGLRSKHQIFLQTFDASSSIVQDFTNDPQILNEKVRTLKAGGGKALYDAIYFACKEKLLKAGPPEDTRRVLLVLSDGRDVQSHHSLSEAISMARKAETFIYTIGIAAYGYDNPGDKILEEISEATGGAAYFPRRETPGTDLATGYLSHGQIGDTSQNKGLGASTGIYSATRLMQLAESLEAIGRELNEQYSIGYTPANDHVDGTYRTIRVEARRKGVEIRWKPGYFAAPQ